MNHEMPKIHPLSEELEIPSRTAPNQVVKQAEVILPSEDEILYNQAINLGFTELQYIRGLRNMHFLSMHQRIQPDERIAQELFTQRLGVNLNFRKMQKYIADNNFLLGACDGNFAALTEHFYMHDLHTLIRANDEPDPEGGTPIVAVMSEVGIVRKDGEYQRITPAVFRVLNQWDNGATLDEAHIIITQQIRQH